MSETLSSKYLRGVIETMSDGLMVVGPDGRVRLVNQALERLTGYAAEELMGRPCSVIRCDACDRWRKEGKDHWCRLFEDRTPHPRLCHIIRKDGGSISVLKKASILEDDGEMVSVETLTDITELERQGEQIHELTRLLDLEDGLCGMLGRSEAMRRVFDILRKAAASDAPVIILGESGAGKELAARAIHDLGPRKDGPYVQLNCAALNESLLESELFGHVKGAFTGAVKHRAGRFEAAHGGDIFLDEIGDVPPPIQVKLLRVLETKLVERVGENTSIPVDVRIITATNRDLSELVRQGRFREDFLFRINVIPIRLPPLRERLEDVPLLADHFLGQIAARAGKAKLHLAPAALARLMEHDWPGNVRELKSALEYAVVVAEGGRIEAGHLPQQLGDMVCAPASVPTRQTATATAPASDEAAEKRELVAALTRTNGNISQAARILGVHRGTVINRMRKYGLDLAKRLEGA